MAELNMRAVVQELTSAAAMPKLSRAPTHADSWYEADSAKLSKQVEQWLAAAGQEAAPSPRAIIAPHAGHRYCGHIMAYAFKNVDITKVSRVFLLGPSHHVHTRRCCLSPATAYDTPLGAPHSSRVCASAAAASYSHAHSRLIIVSSSSVILIMTWQWLVCMAARHMHTQSCIHCWCESVGPRGFRVRHLLWVKPSIFSLLLHALGAPAGPCRQPHHRPGGVPGAAGDRGV
ncbi:UPF0103-domain-containing protein [Haematococcus lacustris]|uniref:UPF0103-domain-containing protein n=1 Tax=Haematococcus lacustris TaxID=44745 RepID=A0A699YS48_HAELA|nr:UPF0103-domain-containing protein [Haematococcus lacustris]